jgi:hypothetical protein
MLEVLNATHTTLASQFFNCWFGSSIPSCTYDRLNPPILFSLGEAISAIGLILAAYQLRTTLWKITLRIRGWWQENSLFILGFVGFVFALIASLTSKISVYALPGIWGERIFYELMSACIFAGAVIFLIWSARPSKLFTKRNKKRFYEVLLGEATRLNSKNIEVVVNIIKVNLSRLLQAVKTRAYQWHREEREDEELTDDQEYSEYAYATMNVILSEDVVAKYIATERLDFIFALIWCIKRYKIDDQHIPMAFEHMMKYLFTDKSSYLYKQGRSYRGLALAVDLYKLIFSNSIILNNFRVFQDGLPTYNEKVDQPRLEVYLKGLEYALKKYWTDSETSLSGVRGGFQKLNEYLKHLNYSWASDFKKTKDQMFKITFFLARTYVYSYKDALQKNTVPQMEKDDIGPVQRNDYYSASISALYAEAIYLGIESLSFVKKEEEETMGLEAHELLSGIHDESSDFLNVRQMVHKKIWDKIEENLKGWYPNVLRVYLSYMAYYLDGYNPSLQVDSWLNTESEKLLRVLYEKLAPKFIAGEKMAGSKKVSMEETLLPNRIIFSKEDGKFYCLWADNKKELKKPE